MTSSRTGAQWNNILVQCGVKPSVAAPWSLVFADTVKADTFSAGDDDLKPFLGQILHESQGLTLLVENLNYSAERLMVVWPYRFPRLEVANIYAHKPEMLGNIVYGGRMGNTEPGDGFKYRGRSPIEATGKDAYIFLGELMGQDLETMPELLEQPHFALEASIHWWEKRIPDSILMDNEKITRKVQGQNLGLADRAALTNLAGAALA